MSKSQIRVTDHAVIRYLERVEGVDIAALRLEIARRVERGVDLGAGAVLVDGLRYCLVENTVTTIHEASRPDARTGRARGKRGFIDE